MNEAIKVTIDVKKLDKSAFFAGKNGAQYVSLIVWPNRDGEDRFGNTATVKQDLGAERKGEQVPILGNARPLKKRQHPQERPQPGRRTGFADSDDSIPF